MPVRQSMPLLGVGLAFCLAAGAARAGAITNVDLSSYYGGAYDGGQWSGEIGGSTIVAAPTDGSTGTGITFSNWAGRYAEIDAGITETITLPTGGVALNSAASVNTLMNNGYGSSAVQAVVTFENNSGQTAQYSLVGGQTIRDYNNGSYENALQGSNTDSSYGAVTAQEWWTNNSGQRLDVQAFVLPSSWSGTDLVSMSVEDPSNSGGLVLLSAMQIVDGTASVPEPMSLALLASGLAGLTLARRARRAP